MKSEPTIFSVDDLKNAPQQTHCWEGVRNYQARNTMRDEMKIGDLAFFYHSNCQEPGIVGIMQIVRESYPDFFAFNPDSIYFDPKTNADNPRWFMVDVQFVQKLAQPISLKTLKQQPELADLTLLKRGNRLSIIPVNPFQWEFILCLA